MKLFDYFKSKKKLLNEHRQMRQFIEKISWWPSCGHPMESGGRLCECRSQVCMEIELEGMAEEACELLKKIK